MNKLKEYVLIIYGCKFLRFTLISQFIMSLAWYASTPYISIYLATSFHAQAYEAGIFVSLGMLSFSLFSPALGVLIDTKLIKVIAYISAIELIIPFALFYYANSLIMFYLGSIMLGIGRAGFSTIINSSISNAVDEVNQKHAAFSMRYIAINIASALGPLIAAMYLKNTHLMFLCSLILYAVSAIIILAYFKPKHVPHTYKSRSNLARGKRSFRLFFLVLGLILFDICFSQMTVLFPLSIRHVINHWETVYANLFVINAVLVIFAQIPISNLASWIGNYRSIILSTILLMLAFTVFSLATSEFEFYTAITLFTFAELIILPLSYIWIDEISPPSQRATYFGIYNLSFIGSALGPILGGAGSQFFGFHAFYLILGFLPLPMLICFMIAINKRNVYNPVIEGVSVI